jgi:hypothetical protein
LIGRQLEGGRFGQPQDVAQRPSEGGGRGERIVVLGLGPVTGELDPHRMALDLDGDVHAARTPRLPVSARIRPAIRSTSWGSHRAWTVCAGRPFFITIGVAHASRAPAASSAVIV